uniref:Uncharacterized protein n=1 Tax=Rhizophora mucronata TaxID=61149 RepID=A0A2P2NEH8_RHIMU
MSALSFSLVALVSTL